MSKHKSTVPGVNGKAFEVTLSKEFMDMWNGPILVIGKVIRHIFEEPIILMTCVDTFVTKDIFVHLTTGMDYYVHELLQDARGTFVYVINDVGEKRCYNIDRFKFK